MDSFKQNKNSVFSAAQCENKKYEAFGNLIWADGTYEDNREFTCIWGQISTLDKLIHSVFSRMSSSPTN